MTIFGLRKNDGLHRSNGTPIDLRPFDLSSDSLLTVVLRAIPCPTDCSTVLSFSAALKELSQNADARELLRTPPRELTLSDVRALFNAIEDVIETWPETARYDRSRKARSYFQNYQGLLGDGTKVSEVRAKFKSRFYAGKPDKPRQGLPGSKAKISDTRVLEDFDTLAERNEKSLGLAKQAQREILVLCDATMDGHEKVREAIEEARGAGLPEGLSKRREGAIRRGGIPSPDYLNALSPYELLRVVTKVVDARGLNREGRTSISLSNLTQFEKFIDTSGERRFETLLADRFLPRQVVVACGLAILTVTGLNPDVLFSLKRRNIERRANSAIIIGLKPKTDSLVEVQIGEGTPPAKSDDDIRIEDRTALRAVDLLLANVAAIERAFNLEDVSLIVGFQYKQQIPSYEWFSFYAELQKFCDWHNHEPIDLRSLRPLATHVNFLSPGGNLYTAQAFLGHKKRRTTVQYLNSTVIAGLFQDNIRRYMRKLEATILYRIGRESEFEERGLTTKDIQLRLFPSSDNSSIKSLADEWIKSNGEMPVKIGMTELHHCVIQYRYYRTAYERLASQNPARFAEVHLPRVLFCFALREAILKSAHAGLLRKVEREQK